MSESAYLHENNNLCTSFETFLVLGLVKIFNLFLSHCNRENGKYFLSLYGILSSNFMFVAFSAKEKALSKRLKRKKVKDAMSMAF